MDSRLFFDIVALLIAFVFASAEIVYACGLFADEMLADLGDGLCVGFFDH